MLLLFPALYLLFAALSTTILLSIASNLALTQLLYFLVGGVGFLILAYIPMSWWYRWHWVIYSVVIVLLVLTLMIGVVRKGATRWIPIGPVHLQTSQFAQPLTVITAAVFLSRYTLKRLSHVLQFSGIVLLPAFLIFVEPNLGTTLIFLASLGATTLLTDLSNYWYMLMVSLGIAAVILGWLFILQPYQKQRITSFFDPDSHAASSYNTEQSKVAIGSGQIWGRGLGHGVQSHLRFLPERQTDFIFASLAEELGLWGSLLVLTLYSAWLGGYYWLLFILKNQRSRLIILGFSTHVFIQTTINIGMNMGLMPVTGVTLPLLSFGGSSLLSFALIMGISFRLMKEHFDHIQTVVIE